LASAAQRKAVHHCQIKLLPGDLRFFLSLLHSWSLGSFPVSSQSGTNDDEMTALPSFGPVALTEH
jgi:hypothetical protein